MIKKLATYGAGLIALYLVVANSMGAANVTKNAGSALSGLVKSFQGRG